MPSVSLGNDVKAAAQAFLSFLNRSTTPFHVVESCEAILKQDGFIELFEQTKFEVKTAGKYYIKKNETSIFAFAIGGAFKPAETGFSIVVAHTDSPCLRVKPISKKTSEQFLQIGVAPYGGGIWRSWFDRDLSVAGQLIFRGAQGELMHKLIDFRRSLLHIPNLAIHLDSENRTKFEFNNEQHLRPILAHISGCAEKPNKDNEADNANEACKKLKNCCITGDHHDLFLKAVANVANIRVEDILDMDLYLYDVQQACLSGLNEEFISGARLDNLVGTYTAVKGLLDSLKDQQQFNADPNVRLVACYDNEEVGSDSAQGAGSHFTESLLRRIVASLEEPTAFECAIGRSLLISADQAHAVHPNYAQKHEDCHKPAFHGGVIVKINANQRYATTAVTHSILKVIADLAGVPLQKVVVRNDCPCGSTVGPILASKIGIQTVDVGCPQLGMHSIRELGDTSSIHYATSLYSTFFKHLPVVLKQIKKDRANN